MVSIAWVIFLNYETRQRFFKSGKPYLDDEGREWIRGGKLLGYNFLWKKLKTNPHYQTLCKQAAQQTIKSVAAAITEKRNRQMRDFVNKAARFVVNWCLCHNVGTVVFGWNKGNKTKIELGKKNNQEFVQIPTARLKKRIQQLCEQYQIRFIQTEESYTSKSSFLDDDFLPTYGGEKPESWKPSGKRGTKKDGLGRGQYQTKQGFRINSDCNGAANILRKVSSQLGLSEVLAEVRRAVLTLPQRYSLRRMTRSYRMKSEATRFQPVA